MIRLMVLGATGYVGGEIVRIALDDPNVSEVIAPTRRPIPGHPRLRNPIVDFEALDPTASWWQVDAVISALGTTTRETPSRAAYERIEIGYPVAVGELTHRLGAKAFAYISSVGASPTSGSFYLRLKGLAEARLRDIGFSSLTLVRPSGIPGPRQPPRPREQLMLGVLRALGPRLPKRWREVTGEQVARALLGAVVRAAPGVHIVESESL